MSESTEDLVLSAVMTEAIVGLSRAFLSAARIWTMYPADHPTCQNALERLGIAVAEAAEAGVGGSLTVLPTSLLAGGRRVPGDDQALADMAVLLHGHGILEIGFDPVVPPDAFKGLLALVGQPAGSFDAEGGVAEAWLQSGHPAIRLEAVNYAKVLEDRDPGHAAPRRDDLWQSIVTALASGRRTLDEREQERLLELAGDPEELTALAQTLMADKCTAGGAPMLTTQAATVLASFRHLASIASVIAPDRAQAILGNLAAALLRIDPRVTMQIVALESQRRSPGTALTAMLDDEAIAQLLATVLALEGQASPRLAQVFELLVPDAGRRRGVLERTRAAAETRYSGTAPFGTFWNPIEELLISYNDQAYVSGEYRAVLDRVPAGGAGDVPISPELKEWLCTVTEERLRQTSIELLGDLLHLETETSRAVSVLDQLAGLADDLLVAGVYEDALRVLETIDDGTARADLAEPAVKAKGWIGAAEGVQQAVALMGDLRPADWARLAECLRRIGPGCLATLRPLVLAPADSVASERAGEVFVSVGEAAVDTLVDGLAGASPAVSRRVAGLLGRIGSASAVPALQGLLRASDPRVVQAAVRALAGIDDRAAARALQVALRVADGAARAMIVDALVEANDRRVVPMLVRVLESSRPLGTDYQVVLHALDALARLQDARAVKAITAVLFLRGWFLRNWISRRKLRAIKGAAARALVRVGDLSALQALARARNAGDRLLRRVAREVQVPSVEGAA